jgi:hypothetical protein
VATAERARLAREVERVTEALWARVEAGDDAGAEAFVRQREDLLAAITALAGPGPGERAADHSRECAESMERIAELDRRTVARLEARKSQVRQQLADLGRGRRSLASYRGPAPLAPAFVDRVS